MAAMMSTITAPRHGARCLGPVIPIVMAEMIAKAGAALRSFRVALPRPLAQCSRLTHELLTQFSCPMSRAPMSFGPPSVCIQDMPIGTGHLHDPPPPLAVKVVIAPLARRAARRGAP